MWNDPYYILIASVLGGNSLYYILLFLFNPFYMMNNSLVWQFQFKSMNRYSDLNVIWTCVLFIEMKVFQISLKYSYRGCEIFCSFGFWYTWFFYIFLLLRWSTIWDSMLYNMNVQMCFQIWVEYCFKLQTWHDIKA